MARTPFAAALEAVLAPLRFAARDELAPDRVLDFEATVAGAAARARKLAVPREVRRELERVEKAFGAPLSRAARARAVGVALRRLAPFAAPGWPAAALAQPVTAVGGIGPRRGAALEKRGLAQVADLLFHLPTRYDDRRELATVGQLEVGRRATFLARVVVADFVPSRRRGGRFGRVLEAVVEDETGQVKLKWFHGGEALQELVKKGTTLLVTGDVKRYRFWKELLHPDVEPVAEGEEAPDLEALRQVVAEYPALDRVPPRAVRRYVHAAVAEYADLV
ncbi:MAG: OB-fold nucleic acid binding domain-containing protein, partial [Myxococcota bacterium]|nr:OB-fold nucleic acid binding domain-containing protein [Myxococcota bacterium]